MENKYSKGRHVGCRYTGGVAVAVVVAILIGMSITGVLSMAATSMYQNAAARSQLAGAYSKADEAAVRVSVYMLKNHAIPSSLQQVGFAPVLPKWIRSMDVDQNPVAIRVTMAIGSIEGKSFVLRPVDGNRLDLSWQCSSDNIRPSLLPERCR